MEIQNRIAFQKAASLTRVTVLTLNPLLKGLAGGRSRQSAEKYRRCSAIETPYLGNSRLPNDETPGAISTALA